jgi:hypothetical protein
MAIYRGAGGAGDAIGGSTSEALLVKQLAIEAAADAAAAEAARVAAVAAQAAAELAETNAETAETNAETAEANAETAEANAEAAQTAAELAETNAETAETNAETAATAAASSASAASTSASNAATSATNASNSASAASTSATNASNSASAAATSATNASNSASAASTSATNAANSATEAASYTPSQTGNSGKFLTTNGTATSWAEVDALPDQTGNSGKYLTTDGTDPSWATLDTAATGFGFKNRIINGAMMIDQRNAGASVTLTDTSNGQYLTDRWYCYPSQASKLSAQQNAGSVTPPTGFTNYLGFTSLSSYSVTSSDAFFVRQGIEGFNTADLGFGTANASTVTLSFWVRSSLTGTFGGSLRNAAATRSYPYTYTINSANTWEQKTITIAGDTSGTWVGATNGAGMYVFFGLGVGSNGSTTAGAWATGNYSSATGATSVVGTNGATFYITGVQLEKGSTATSFDYRPYGTELQLCQRYYEILMQSSSGDANRPSSTAATTSDIYFNILYKVNKRTTSPTVSFTAGEVFTGLWNSFTSPTVTGANDISAQLTGIRAGLTQNGSYLVRNSSITVSAEL